MTSRTTPTGAPRPLAHGEPTAGVRWTDRAERGAAAGIWFIVVVATALGRPAAQAFVRFVALYYVLFDPTVRRVSSQYLARVGLPADRRAVHRHVLCFAQVAVDRLFLLRGRTEGLAFSRTGHEHIERLSRSGRGAIILGAHLGSFEALRAHAQAYGVRVTAVVDFRNARIVNAILKRASDSDDFGVLHVSDDKVELALQVRDRVKRGELIAILADRVARDDRAVLVDLLGGKAAIPTGPFLLGASMGCPVYFAAALFRAPDRYELHCEPLFERITLPRGAGERGEALASHAQAYATCLERYVRLAPDNWFNFFDLWVPS